VTNGSFDTSAWTGFDCFVVVKPHQVGGRGGGADAAPYEIPEPREGRPGERETIHLPCMSQKRLLNQQVNPSYLLYEFAKYDQGKVEGRTLEKFLKMTGLGAHSQHPVFILY
jgi:hypothetical protein